MLRERVSAGAGGAGTTPGGPSPVSPTLAGGMRPQQSSGSSDDDEHAATESTSLFGRLSGLLYSVWSPIDRMIGAGNVAPPSEVAAARRFSSWFTTTYGDGNVNSVPGFAEAGFSEVLRLAAPNHTFVFVYIHSDLNQDADAFCRNALCHPPLLDYLRENTMVWGGDVSDRYGMEAATMCGVTSFPFVALYLPETGRKIQRVFAHEGDVSGAELLRLVTAAVLPAIERRDALQAEEIARREDAELRDEQTRRFEAVLAQDRAAEAKRAAEAAQQEAEAEAREVQSAMELSKQLTKESSMDRLRQSLPPEPALGSGTLTTLRITFPGGVKVQRRFHSSDTLQTLFDFVRVSLSDLKLGDIETRFDVGCNMPRRVFPCDGDASSDLVAAGLHPQAVVFVTIRQQSQ